MKKNILIALIIFFGSVSFSNVAAQINIICESFEINSVDLTVTGCSNIVWLDNNLSSNPRVILTAGTYTVKCNTDNTTKSITIPNPVACPVPCSITASANPVNIFSGNSSTLTAIGCAGSVSWNNGAGNGASVNVSPTISTTYTATCSDGSTCTAQASVNVIGQPNCNITASANPTNIFSGSNSILSVTGCEGSVSWNTGQVGFNISVSPSGTSTFIATCTIATPAGDVSCQTPVLVTVTPIPPCNLQVQANPSTVFVGQPITLTVNGCSGSVSWSSGQSGTSAVVYPQQNMNYVAYCTIVTPAGNVTCDGQTIIKAIQPYLSISANSDILFYSETIWTALANQNINIFQWQYSLDGGESWLNSPANFDNNNTLTTSAITLLGANAPNYLNKQIKIRAISTLITSNVLTVTIRQNAPTITQLTSTLPSCFGKNDANFTLNLSRGLFSGEEYFLLRVYLLDNGIEKSEIKYTFTGSTFSSLNIFGNGNYRLKLQSIINGQGSLEYVKDFTIEGRTQVSFNANAIPIKCFGGNDGQIIANASGGTGIYQYTIFGEGAWQSFNGNQLQVIQLKLGAYDLQIRDSNGCRAKENPVNLVISQPKAALTIKNFQLTDPLGYQRKDGLIVLNVEGGTQSYNFIWTLAATLSNQNNEGVIKHTNNGLGDGTYTIVITDANYLSATDKAGCITQATYKLTEPPQIQAEFKIIQGIKCFGRSDGSVLAIASGGVPFANEPKYSFTWKVKASSKLITNDTALAENIAADTYICTVTDKNNISRDFEFVLTQPTKVVTTITNLTNLLCNGDKNGSISIDVKGGILPHTISWNNEQTGNSLKQLVAGKYFAFIADANGCVSQINATITEPAKLSVLFEAINPSCFDVCDGRISAFIKGGKAPYSSTWTNSKLNTLSLDKLCDGAFELAVKDSNGCLASEKLTLVKPAKKEVTLRSNTFICNGQTVPLNATIQDAVAYLWKTPQGDTPTTAIIDAKTAGNYAVVITDKNNCKINGQITLQSSATSLKQEFAVSTKIGIGQKLVLVNLSDPKPDKTSWIVPPEAAILTNTEDLLEILFDKPGEYLITMKSKKGDCDFEYSKKIIVTQELQAIINQNLALENDFIKDFTILPNPTNGDFKVRISLKETDKVKLKIVDTYANGSEIFSLESNNAANYELPIFVPNANTGTYLLTLETSKGLRFLRLVIIK